MARRRGIGDTGAVDWQLWLLAFEAALYPTLLAAVVILLSQPRRLPLLSAYLAGGLTISIGLGCIIVFALGGTVKGGSGSTLSWTADLAIGGLALIAAVALAVRADERMAARRAERNPDKAAAKAEKKAAKADNEPWADRILSKGSVPIVFASAMAINVPGAAYLIGLKDIAAAQSSTATSLGQILLFNAIMFLLAEIPLVGLLVAPEATERLVKTVNDWFSSHGRQIAICLAFALGVFLVVRGIKNS